MDKYDISGFDPKTFKTRKKKSSLAPHVDDIKQMIKDGYFVNQIADKYFVTNGTMSGFCSDQWGPGYLRRIKDGTV